MSRLRDFFGLESPYTLSPNLESVKDCVMATYLWDDPLEDPQEVAEVLAKFILENCWDQVKELEVPVQATLGWFSVDHELPEKKGLE